MSLNEALLTARHSARINFTFILTPVPRLSDGRWNVRIQEALKSRPEGTGDLPWNDDVHEDQGVSTRLASAMTARRNIGCTGEDRDGILGDATRTTAASSNPDEANARWLDNVGVRDARSM